MLKNNSKRTRIFEVENSIKSKETEVLKMTKKEFLDYLLDTIDMKKRYDSIYAWSGPNCNCSERISRERWTCGTRKFLYDGHLYEYCLSYTSSRTNYYLEVNCLSKDGKGNMWTWKNLIKEIDPEFYAVNFPKRKKKADEE